MQCSNCGYHLQSVVSSEKNTLRNVINRRRECLKCGVRFTTQEKIKEKAPYVLTPPHKILPA